MESSRDVVAVGRYQIRHGPSDFFRSPEPLQRNLIEQLVANLLGNPLDHLGLDESRREGVDRHPFAGELLGERLREGRDARLRRRIVRLAEVPDLPDHRGDVHDASVVLLEHLVDEDLRAVEDAVQVDGEDLAPRGVVHLHERLVRVDPGIVHENVEAAELTEDFLRHPERVRIVTDVGLRDERPPAHRLDRIGDVARGLFARHVIHHDVRALLGEGERDGATDSA